MIPLPDKCWDLFVWGWKRVVCVFVVVAVG